MRLTIATTAGDTGRPVRGAARTTWKRSGLIAEFSGAALVRLD